MKPELIEKFFRKGCTPQESKQVALYLKENPDVLEKYISLKEWEATGKEFMPKDFWDEAWVNIQKKNKQKHLVVSIKRITAIAAALIIVASSIWFFSPQQKSANKSVVAAKVHPKTEHKFLTNTTNKILSVVLEDSSVIQLSPASTVQYDVPFPANKREIFLDGEAEFHVTKNKQKPFTVYAGSFATTALGTIFSVKKDANKKTINVKLYRGKVVIHATENMQGWKNDVYLLAGEQMKFNMQTSMLIVNKINNANNTLANNVAKTKKAIEDSVANELNFSNTLLPEVMKKLSAVYNVKIQFDSLAIDSIRFTGIISKTDSLSVILNAISQMNNLDVIKDDDEFEIRKHQP